MGMIDQLREVVELVQKADNIDLLRKMLGLQTELTTLVEENKTLRNRVRQLEEEAQLRQKVTFRDHLCWLEEDPHPYCPRCYESDGKLVHLKTHGNGDRECLVCKNWWYGPGGPGPVGFDPGGWMSR
jgi:hypothetical protein